MEQPKKPLWKKSMLKTLGYSDIIEYLDEIGNNGDMYGYEREESGYYQEYKELFDDLAAGANNLYYVLSDYYCDGNRLYDNWDDMTVALLGYQEKVLGYDAAEMDYYAMIDCAENWAVEEAEKRLMRLTKEELINSFRKVMTTLVCFFDIKSAHDCLTAIVEELDNRGAILEKKNEYINELYKDLTGENAAKFDSIIENIPPRMWVE